MKDGTYIKAESGEIVDYASKWAYGYIVGIQPVFESMGIQTREDWVTGAIVQIPAHKLFGIWTDEDGTVYVDYVEHVDTLSAALSKARERGELAVWDLRNEREIRV